MKRIFIDFDGCIVNSTKTFCSVYNRLYDGNADWTKVRKYNFKDQCPLIENPEKIFQMTYFFNELEFFPHAKEVIKKLNQKYDLYICTIGTTINIQKKSEWLDNNLLFVKNRIYIDNGFSEMGKDMINMYDSAFIDDVSFNLKTSNANREEKYCFKNIENCEWNKDWLGKKVSSWKEIEKIFL